MAGGRLFVDENGCLRLKPDRGTTWIPVWPVSLRLEAEDGRIRTRNSGGRTVAEVGKEVAIGGGQIGPPKDVVSPRMARELRNRCCENPEDYWVAISPFLGPATPVVSTSPQG